MSVADLRALMALQEADTAVDQLRHRRQQLPERVTTAAAEKRLADALRAVAERSAARDDLAAQAEAEERQVSEIDDRIETVDRRMRQPGTAPRDVERMMLDNERARERKSDHEDRLLELMEELETLEADVAGVESARDAAGRDVIAGRAALTAAAQAVDAELGPAVAHRDRVGELVPASLRATYTRLRERLGGEGAAWLETNRCTGCHLTLSAAELDDYNRLPDDELPLCESCGRILVRR